MSFQAYIDNIEAKTGKSTQDIYKEAKESGVITADMKATQLVEWLKATYGLGHGHCMALWALYVSKDLVQTKHSKLKG